MRINRKVAAVLAAVMLFGSSMDAFAATSSATKGNSVGFKDTNTTDHTKNTVVSTITKTGATVEKATSSTTKAASAVEFKVARNKNGSTTNINVIGTGKKGVFDSKKGRRIKTVTVNSKASKVVVKKLAFKKSNVKTLKVATKKLVINKNAFKGTKRKQIVLKFVKKKASALSLKKGAFNGLKKITIKGLSKKQKKLAKKKLKAAGFKGTIK